MAELLIGFVLLKFYTIDKKIVYKMCTIRVIAYVVYARTNPTQPLNLAHGKSCAQPQAPSYSLKEVSGQVEGKLSLGMQLTHLHGRPRNS